jgi:predicted esterase
MKKLLYGLMLLLGLNAGYASASASSLITEMPPQAASTSTSPSTPACDLTGFTHAQESDGTIVVLPASYSKQKQYPAIVLLPYTDSTACRFFNRVFRDLYSKSEIPYIVILPSGTASRADYSTGELFEATVGRFETALQDDLKTLPSKYSIDGDRISVAGFSFGADLGWALSLRNPSLFNGAFLIDSLCSYRADDNMSRLARGDARFFLVAGRKEAGESDHPMNDVKRLLDQYRIPNVYESFSEASHSEIIQDIPTDTYQKALGYILAEE